MHDLLIAALAVVIVGYVIGRQLRGEALRGKRLIVLPAVLTAVGALSLRSHTHPVEPKDIAFLVAGGVVVALIGAAQGGVMRLRSHNGALWGQMPAKGLWLWALLVASRVVMMVFAGMDHAHVASSTAPILLMLGINRLAQAAVVAPRALLAGVPFAPEKDGSVLFAGMFGASTSSPWADGQLPTTRSAQWSSLVRPDAWLAQNVNTPAESDVRTGARR